MADRIFAGLLLACALAYTAVALTSIRAPFQYDPLGPESWPQLLGVAASLCAFFVVLRPDVARFDATFATLGRLLVLVVMLSLYAWAFQPLGFVPATLMFCVALSLMLGARPLAAGLFGFVTSVVGYLVCVHLLDLNLPSGLVTFLG